MPTDETTAPAAISADEQRLHELGYAQELRRHMSGFNNFAVSSAIISILSGCVLFMLPTASPITWTNFNYTVIAVVAVLGFAGIWWLASARKWFTGPKVQGSPAELAAIEAELESLA